MLRVFKGRNWLRVGVGAVVIVLAYSVVMLVLPAPEPVLTMELRSGQVDTGKMVIQWPTAGSAALGTEGYGVLAANKSSQALPTASMAKAILAMSVLRKKPIPAGQTGPVITLTDKDVGYYQFEVARDGSVVRVAAGETLTEYQALEGLLLPSGNNMAATLADWAFGGEVGYTEYANAMLKSMGLTKTYVSDASGYSPVTVSTPSELVLVGIEALKDPIFRQIVSEKQAVVPVAGLLHNTNSALGHSDINGIKTGHTASSGDCLLFSATRNINGKDITVVGALQGMPGDDGATLAAPGLIDDAYKNLVTVEAVAANKVVGVIRVPWAPPTDVKTNKAISQTVWSGTPLNRDVTARTVTSGKVGQVKVGSQTSDLVLSKPVPKPSFIWRLTHPGKMLEE